MLYRISWVIIWPFLRIFFSAKGKEHVPASGPYVLVANHVYDIDPYYIGPFLSFGTVIHWLAKKELFHPSEIYDEYLEKMLRIFSFLPKGLVRLLNWPFVCWVSFLIRFSLTIPVDRKVNNARMNRLAVKRALQLLRAGKVVGVFGEGGIGRDGEVHPVFVALARKAGCPILPAKVVKGGVVFGEAIDLRGDERDTQTVAKEIMNRIYAL
jgi:1-acyl-sn-glycerol-3-phosphate acyltransferase